MPDEHNNFPEENCTLEEFSKAIDQADPAVCGMCPSLGHYKHLSPKLREISWLAYVGRESERQKLLLEELEKSLGVSYGNETYQLILQCELMKPVDPVLSKRVNEILFHYARLTVEDKAPEAWAVVRAYAWLGDFNPDLLLTLADTDDLTVKQVVLQCSFNWSVPYWDDQDRAQKIRDRVYEITLGLIESDREKTYVPSYNGILALMSFQDKRALELFQKQKRDSFRTTTGEHIVRIIGHIREKGGDQSFIDVLNKMRS
jgi:hypothetical protein